MADEFKVVVVHTAPAPIADTTARPRSLGIDADERGRVLFRETVESNKFEEGFDNCVAMAKAMIIRTASIANNYRVESIKLKLGVDAKFGVVFVGDASLAASIEVEIKRVATE